MQPIEKVSVTLLSDEDISTFRAAASSGTEPAAARHLDDYIFDFEQNSKPESMQGVLRDPISSVGELVDSSEIDYEAVRLNLDLMR